MVKKLFIRQPFEVGSKKSKSLGINIPSPIVKENNLNTATIFFLSSDDSGIRLEYVDRTRKNLMSVDSSLATAQSTDRNVR